MTDSNIAILINLLGWTIGLALYAMLLTMSVRTLRLASPQGTADPAPRDRQTAAGGVSRNGFDPLPLATALLGVLWNAGALATQGLHGLGVGHSSTPTYLLLGAASFAALGFLPAVVVHSAIQNLHRVGHERSRRVLTSVAYALSTVAAGMHFYRAFTAGGASSETALRLLTGGFALLMAGLFLLTRREPGWPRAVWATALAVFAVSALHLSTGSGPDNHERWYVELIGHHASLPLVSAILYQDYRFAFADIFLKRALALLAYVALVAGAFGLYVWLFPAVLMTGDFGTAGADASAEAVVQSRSIGVLLALWLCTGLLYPRLQRVTRWFVDSIVLRRVDYTALRAQIARIAHRHEAIDELLDDVCLRLRPTLTARELTWRIVESSTNVEEAIGSANGSPSANALGGFGLLPSQSTSAYAWRRGRGQSTVINVPTTEPPRYELKVGELAGGRRLLSDDFEMLESVALTIARRIDALRVTHERCEQVQREQEIAKLATEAQLRALRAQVNPHFLFNALTTIGYLIQTSPDRALETLLRLTDLLRRVLRSTAEWVTLGEELKLTESYLDIERARFEERLRVTIDVPPELHSLSVPSLVVQPLVENAIKHGIAPLRSGGELSISARLIETAGRGKDLCITVRDTGAGAGREQFAEGRAAGVGLANVEQRLRLCCGEAARLSVESAPGAGAAIEIRLPLRRVPLTTARPSPAYDNKIGDGNGTALAKSGMAERRAG